MPIPRPARVLLTAGALVALAATPIVVSAESASASGAVVISQSNVTVSGLHVSSTGPYGIKVTGKNVTLRNVTVDLRDDDGKGGSGIVDRGDGTHIDGAVVRGNGDGISVGRNGYYDGLDIAMTQTHLKGRNGDVRHTDAAQMGKGLGADSTVTIINSRLDAAANRGGNSCFIWETGGKGRHTGRVIVKDTTCLPGNMAFSAKESKGEGTVDPVTFVNVTIDESTARYGIIIRVPDGTRVVKDGVHIVH